jgi:hypothetical protein
MEADTQHTEFELFLKQQTDSFKMTPNTRVWHGIYNTLHPSSKMPSLAVASLFVFALLLFNVSPSKHSLIRSDANLVKLNQTSKNENQVIAHLAETTTNAIQQFAKESNNEKAFFDASVAAQNVSNAAKKAKNNANEAISENNATVKAQSVSQTQTAINVVPTDDFANSKTSTEYQYSVNQKLSLTDSNVKATDLVAEKPAASVIQESKNSANLLRADAFGNANASNNSVSLNETFVASNQVDANKKSNGIIEETAITQNVTNKEIANSNSAAIAIAANTLLDDKMFRENDILINKPKQTIKQKLLAQGSMVYHATANKTFRTVRNKYFANGLLNDMPALGLEVGAAVNYPLTNNTTLSLGAQFNYNNYVSEVVKSDGLTANNTSSINSSAVFSEKIKRDKFNNSTSEISIPIGVNIAFFNTQKAKLILAMQLQPSYLVGGNAYKFDEVNKALLEQKDVLRKFNVNAGAALLLEVKTAKNIAVQFGPQIRHQLFSTQKANYPFKEHLQSVGLNLGLVKRF